MAWFALRVQSGANLPNVERISARLLRGRGVDALFTAYRKSYEQKTIYRRIRKQGIFADLPNYILADLTLQQYMDCNELFYGIDQILYIYGRPCIEGSERSDGDYEKAYERHQLPSDWFDKYRFKTTFPDGKKEPVLFLPDSLSKRVKSTLLNQLVTINEGPFEHFEGTVTKVVGNRLKLDVDVFGRTNKIELDSSKVRLSA